MKAGIELDKLVAEKVMDCIKAPSAFYDDLNKKKKYWCLCGSPTREEINIIEFVDGEWQQYLFSPSLYIHDAWQIVEEFKGYKTVDICSRAIGGFDVYIQDVGINADTAPLAICLAALKAVGDTP